jgi:hypothetical protein
MERQKEEETDNPPGDEMEAEEESGGEGLRAWTRVDREVVRADRSGRTVGGATGVSSVMGGKDGEIVT